MDGSGKCFSARSRRFLIAILVIAGVAFAFRLLVSSQLKTHYTPVVSPSEQTDNFTYQKYANQILEGEYDYSKGFYYQPLYYAVYLPATYACSGSSVWGVIISQSLLGGLTVLLTGLAFAMLFGRRCGIIAAVLLALCRFHIFYTPFTLIAILQSFWMALLLYLAVAAVKRRTWWLWALVGLIGGLANCTRGNIILMMPILVLMLILTQRQLSRIGLNLVLMITLFVLPQLPFSIVNYRAHGKWVGASTAGAAVLGLGNTPEAPPGGRGPGSAGPMEYPESYRRWLAADKREGDERVPLSRNILNWFKQEPLAYIELKFRTFLLFWNRMEIPNNVSVLSQNKPIPVPMLHWPIFLDFWLLGSLGLGGFFFAMKHCRRRRGTWLAALLVFIYCISIVLFYMLARFRVPVLPGVCGFAGLAISMIWERWRRWSKDHRQLFIHAGMLGLGFLVVCAGYQLYRLGWESTIVGIARPDGVRISYGDKETVKDYGPQSFGGWGATDQTKEVVIEKTLVPLHALADYSGVKLRIAVIAGRPGELVIQTPGSASKHTMKQGLQWLEVELPSKQCVYYIEETGVTLKLRLTADVEFAPLLDYQRSYGRSQINGTPLAGEFLVELSLFHDPKPAQL